MVASGFGLPVRRILLYPLGGFSEIEQEPPTPGREFLVSAAGPGALAGAGGARLRCWRGRPPGRRWPGLLIEQLVWANLLVGIFNLLPGLPLDGGRMLRAGVWKLTGRPGTATVAAAWAGRVLAVAVLVVPHRAVAARQASQVQIFDVVWLGGHRRVHVDRARPSRCAPAGSGSGCPRCRPGRWPGGPSRSRPRLPLAEAIRRADAAGARALVIVDHEDKPIAIVNEAR